MEEYQNLVMSSTHPEFVQWTYYMPGKELIDRIEQLEQRLKNVESKSKSPADLLKEWIPLTYKEKYIEDTATQGQHGLWESVLAPYIAAYLVGIETRLTYKEFNERYDMNIKSSSYSNWTACYFYGAKTNGHLFTKEELIKWWKKLGVPKEDYDRVLDDLVIDGRIKIKQKRIQKKTTKNTTTWNDL